MRPLSKTETIFLFIAIFFLAGSGIIFWYFKYKTITQREITELELPITREWSAYKSKDGFIINYPSEWSFGENKNGGACLGSDQKYVNFYCYGQTNIDLPKFGFKAKLRVDKNLVPNGMSQEEALLQEGGRGVLPLIDSKYLTINEIPAYRALRQIKKGEPASFVKANINDVTRTDVEYSFLNNNDLYRIWFELDSNKPDEYILLFDEVAQTFRLEKE